jgi:hypothetical protein
MRLNLMLAGHSRLIEGFWAKAFSLRVFYKKYYLPSMKICIGGVHPGNVFLDELFLNCISLNSQTRERTRIRGNTL